MTPYIIIRLTMAGKTITVQKGGVYRLNRIEGIESPDYDVRAEEYSTMPGGYLSEEHVPVRNVSLTFTVDDIYRTEEERKKLISFFGIGKTGELEVERAGAKRKLQIRMAASPTFEQANIHTDRLKVTVQMMALSPYFEATVPVEIRFGTVIPLLNFPLTFVSGVGVDFGKPEVTDYAVLYNDGDVGAGLVLTVRASGGRITNPYVYLDREYVRVLTVLEAGDELVIDTRTGKKSIRINGENRLLFDRNSTFFSVPPGEHTVRVGADGGKEYIDAQTEIVYQYNGV